MLGTSKILNYLQSIDDPTVDEAMAIALQAAESQDIALIMQAILKRQKPAGLLGLVNSYHRLTPELQANVLSFVPKMDRPLREAATHGNVTSRINVIEIVRQSRDLKLIYLLADELKHGPRPLHAPAADALLELAQWASQPPSETSANNVSPENLLFLQHAIEESLAHYHRHQCEQILLAAAELAPMALPAITDIFNERDHAATTALCPLIESAKDQVIRQSMLLWLKIPTLTDSVYAGFKQAVYDNKISDLLTHGHMLCLPHMRELLHQVPEPQNLLPTHQNVECFTASQLQWLPLWITYLPLPAELCIHELNRFLELDHLPTRLEALRQLTLLPQAEYPTALQTVERFCLDTDETIARIAMRHLIRCSQENLPQFMLKMVNSPHESIRQLATELVSPYGFERFWQAWPKLNYVQRLTAGRALLKIDKQFHLQLSDKIRSHHVPDQLRAINMIDILNQGIFFEAALITLVKHSDDKIAATAVSALGGVPNDHVTTILKEALTHSNSRVRANAVESLTKINHTDHVDELIHMAENDDNRPRANAIAALMDMKLGDAIVALETMLSDQRPMHRISALWIVEHMGLIEMARQVTELSLRDSQATIRKRANNVMTHLIDSLEDHSTNTDNLPLTSANQPTKEPLQP